jgi:hypothetical protein
MRAMPLHVEEVMRDLRARAVAIDLQEMVDRLSNFFIIALKLGWSISRVARLFFGESSRTHFFQMKRPSGQ